MVAVFFVGTACTIAPDTPAGTARTSELEFPSDVIQIVVLDGATAVVAGSSSPGQRGNTYGKVDLNDGSWEPLMFPGLAECPDGLVFRLGGPIDLDTVMVEVRCGPSSADTTLSARWNVRTGQVESTLIGPISEFSIGSMAYLSSTNETLLAVGGSCASLAIIGSSQDLIGVELGTPSVSWDELQAFEEAKSCRTTEDGTITRLSTSSNGSDFAAILVLPGRPRELGPVVIGTIRNGNVEAREVAVDASPIDIALTSSCLVVLIDVDNEGRALVAFAEGEQQLVRPLPGSRATKVTAVRGQDGKLVVAGTRPPIDGLSLSDGFLETVEIPECRGLD